MSANQFWPSLLPSVNDPLWFNVDRPKDDESELAALEEKHQSWVCMSTGLSVSKIQECENTLPWDNSGKSSLASVSYGTNILYWTHLRQSKTES